MEMRELGRTGEKVSAVGVGTWVTGGVNWGGADDAESIAAFRRAVDLGTTFFDTAPIYGFGRAEKVLGEALRGIRDRVFLATKFGLVWNEANEGSNDLSPKSILAECDASLARLGTDRIDLYQAHWPLPGDAMTRTVAEDMMATLEKLRGAGKVRHFGVSNFKPAQMDWCGGGEKLASLQPPLSLLRPGAKEELLPYCAERGIGVVCYSPLFRGLLSGKYKGDETFAADDSRSKHPDYSGQAFRDICAAAQGMKPLADAHGTTIAGVALNWVLSTPGVTVAIAGVRKASHIEEAVRGAGWRLSGDEYAELERRFAPMAKIFK